jgi:hypothetical protein
MRWWLIALIAAPFAARAEPCCGPITPERRQLERFLDDSGVDHLWLAGWHIDWRTEAAGAARCAIMRIAWIGRSVAR